MNEWHLESYIPLLFPLFWVLICFVIAQVGGWQALAGVYRAQQPFEGRRWRFQSGRMRFGTGYNNALTIGASPTGLHLSVFVLFRAGHPELFVPWSEVSLSSRTSFFVAMVRFEFRQVPEAPLTIRKSLADKLEAQAGAAWPLPRVEPI